MNQWKNKQNGLIIAMLEYQGRTLINNVFGLIALPFNYSRKIINMNDNGFEEFIINLPHQFNNCIPRLMHNYSNIYENPKFRTNYYEFENKLKIYDGSFDHSELKIYNDGNIIGFLRIRNPLLSIEKDFSDTRIDYRPTSLFQEDRVVYIDKDIISSILIHFLEIVKILYSKVDYQGAVRFTTTVFTGFSPVFTIKDQQRRIKAYIGNTSYFNINQTLYISKLDNIEVGILPIIKIFLKHFCNLGEVDNLVPEFKKTIKEILKNHPKY